MESYVIFMIVLALLLAGSPALTMWLWGKAQKETNTLLLEMSMSVQKQMDSAKEVMLSHSNLLDKSLALLAAGDPLAYQAIQVMPSPSGYSDTNTFDPSDEAEMELIAKRSPRLAEQGPDAFDDSILADFDPGF